MVFITFLRDLHSQIFLQDLNMCALPKVAVIVY